MRPPFPRLAIHIVHILHALMTVLKIYRCLVSSVCWVPDVEDSSPGRTNTQSESASFAMTSALG